MRILRVRVDGRRIVDLHPAVSVVTGLDAEQAARLRRGVASITSGLAPEGGGLLEAHGLLLDAEQDDLDLLDLASDPVPGVMTAATLELGGGDARLDRLRTAERDALLLATDRRWATAALAAASRRPDAGSADLARAEQLRLAVALHEASDVEPLRLALDADRDARRLDAGSPATAEALVEALAGLGIDLRGQPIGADEVRRIADDLLDEHHRHAAWVVGARVELDGLERRLHATFVADPRDGRPALPESVERRAERATTAHADAIGRADALRDELAGEPSAPVTADDLGRALLRAVGGRDRDHPSGTAPLLLDRVFAGLADGEVEGLLDRLRPLARGVQLLVVDDHPAAEGWARRAGTTTAAAVAPTPAPAARTSPTMPPTPTQRRATE